MLSQIGDQYSCTWSKKGTAVVYCGGIFNSLKGGGLTQSTTKIDIKPYTYMNVRI